jgi:hypothetical protein
MEKKVIQNWGGTIWLDSDINNSTEIDVTVALPTWENKNIIWLQLESLCKQETQYKWELVVCEEQTENMAGEEMILSYKDRLKKAGCMRISYIPLQEHTPLSKKWWIISHASFGSSYLLTASDDYSPPNRIELSHQYLNSGYDWFEINEALFINLTNFITGTFVSKLPKTGVLMATKTELVKGLKGPWPKKFVDNWMVTHMGDLQRYRYYKLVKGFFTDGANKLSTARKNLYSNINKYGYHFKSPTQKIEDIIEPYIIDKLRKEFFISEPNEKIKSREIKVLPKKEVVKTVKKVLPKKEVVKPVKKVLPKKEVVKPVKKVSPKKEVVKPVKTQKLKKFINIRKNRGKI